MKTGAFSSALKRKLPFLGGLCALDSPWRGPKRQLLAVSAKDKNATHATTSSSETDRQLVADGTVLFYSLSHVETFPKQIIKENMKQRINNVLRSITVV